MHYTVYLKLYTFCLRRSTASLSTVYVKSLLPVHANSVEQNGRDMNHLHGSFIPQILKLHDFEEVMKDGQKRVLSWMGSLATACLPYEIQRLGEGGEGQSPIDVDVDSYELLEESAGHVSMEDVYKAKHPAHTEGDPSPTTGVHIAGLANMPRECRETYPEDEGLRRLDTECDSESLLYRLYDEVDNAVREYESAEDKSDGGAANEKLCMGINRLHTWVACQRSTVFHKHTATCKKNGCKGDDIDCCRGFGPTAERVCKGARLPCYVGISHLACLGSTWQQLCYHAVCHVVSTLLCATYGLVLDDVAHVL